MRETKPNVVFVTGGAGFIGSAVVRELLTNSDTQVVVIDKLTYAGNLQSIPKDMKTSRFHFEKVDICDAVNIRILFDKYRPDIVMHLAAESHVDRSIDGPMEFIQTNVVGTSVLLEAARQYWERYCKPEGAPFLFHHISTDEVYGDLPHPDDKHTLPLPLFVESTPYAPSSPYSSSKASSDHLVRSWHRTYGLPTLVTNCSNNYGPYHFPEKLVPHVILNAISGKPLPIYGDGSQIRDWLYVEDHARALVLVATEGKAGETYNIGGHNEKRNIDVVRTLCDILNDRVSQKPEGIADFKQLITYVADRPGHDRRYAIDASKIENELGWVPQESFESGLQKTVDWFLINRWWWENVLSGSYKLERLGEGN